MTTIPSVHVMRVVDSDPGSLLAVRIGEHGWALATEIDRSTRRRLVERLGAADAPEMEQVDAALRAVLDL